MTRLFAFLFLALPALAQAQSWPVHENIYVNDYAKVIDEDAETRIRKQLQVLREETGVEVTVLTLFTRWGYENAGSFEDFATGLFNHWGIGDAKKNDGILILVISEDREMRVELGAGYPGAFDRLAQDVIDYDFVPAFKDGRMSEGIEIGTDSVINRIARVHAAGDPAPEPRGGGGIPGFVWAVLALVAAGIGWSIFGRRIRDRVRRCPQCGHRGIHTARETVKAATRAAKGQGRRIVTCPNCDYHDVTAFTISRISSSSSSSSGGSFGGGSSSGGGASGRW